MAMTSTTNTTTTATTTTATTTTIKEGDIVHQSESVQLAFSWRGVVKKVLGNTATLIWNEHTEYGELEYDIDNLTVVGSIYPLTNPIAS